MFKLNYLLPLLIVGCSSPGVVKVGDNVYTITEKSQPTQAAAEHIPDPAIDDINNTAKDYCDQNKQKVKVLSMDKPIDPTIRQENFKLTFSCINPDSTAGVPAPNAGMSPNAQRLQELKQLRDQGVITQGEFEAKRTQILQQM